MKKILGWSVLFFLLIFAAAPLAYPEPKSSVDNMEKKFQQDGSPCGRPPVMHDRMEQMMPCDKGHIKEMPQPGQPPLMHIQGLELDEKQQDELKNIENDAVKELIRKRADEQIAQIELQELLEKETVDLTAVEKKLKQIETIKTQSQFIVVKSKEKMKAKLTPKQREILKKIRPMGHPGMRPPITGEMMHDQTKMPPPSARERGE